MKSFHLMGGPLLYLSLIVSVAMTSCMVPMNPDDHGRHSNGDRRYYREGERRYTHDRHDPFYGPGSQGSSGSTTLIHP